MVFSGLFNLEKTAKHVIILSLPLLMKHVLTLTKLVLQLSESPQAFLQLLHLYTWLLAAIFCHLLWIRGYLHD
jgi:hypothetical protein